MPVDTRRRRAALDPPTAVGYGSSTAWSAGGPATPTSRRRRKDPAWARTLVVMGAVLMVLSGALIVGSKALISQATSGIDQENLLGESGKSDAEGGRNLNGPIDLLLLGVDVRGSWNHNDTRPDTIIILHIPATHDRAYLISVPRDTEVAIPPFPTSKFAGATEKINSAFYFGARNGGNWAGGTQLLAATIKRLTGISFDGAAIIDFGGFKNVIDALGTVHMCVDQRVVSHHMAIYDGKPAWLSDLRKEGKKGTPVVHVPGCKDMAGWEALDYARQRYGLPGGDYDRQRHQQQLLKAMAAKAVDGGMMTNPVKLNSLIRAAGKAFTLDTGGVPIADFIFTMRGVTANDLTLLRTNNGTFNAHRTSTEERERLTPQSRQMFQAVKDDTLAQFIAANPAVLAPKTPA